MTSEDEPRGRGDESLFRRDARRFRVVRDEDESGVSGTGVVAVGSEFPSGAVVFEWLNDMNPKTETRQNGLTVKPGPDGVDDFYEVHGHGGRTYLEWIDPPRSYREGDVAACASCGDRVPVERFEGPDGLSCPACGEDPRPRASGDLDAATVRTVADLLDDLEQEAEEEVDGFRAGVEYAVERLRDDLDLEP